MASTVFARWEKIFDSFSRSTGPTSTFTVILLFPRFDAFECFSRFFCVFLWILPESRCFEHLVKIKRRKLLRGYLDNKKKMLLIFFTFALKSRVHISSLMMSCSHKWSQWSPKRVPQFTETLLVHKVKWSWACYLISWSSWNWQFPWWRFILPLSCETQVVLSFFSLGPH
jgi:hypothetical protein